MTHTVGRFHKKKYKNNGDKMLSLAAWSIRLTRTLLFMMGKKVLIQRCIFFHFFVIHYDKTANTVKSRFYLLLGRQNPVQ